jgi:hypothetical protein
MYTTIKKRKKPKEHHYTATLHHTSQHCNTSLHFTTFHPLHLPKLRFLSFTLHYPLIWLNPFTFPTALIHLITKLDSKFCKLISKMLNPFTALKNLSPFHFTPPHLSYQHFTSLYFAIYLHNALPFTSLPFTFYHLLFPSLVFMFLTLVLKICVLPWDVPIAPFGSWFQSVMDLFTKEYFPMFVFWL